MLPRTLYPLLISAFIVTGCGFLRTDMQKVQLGMSQEEVHKAIGKPKNVVRAAMFGETKTEVWEYPAESSAKYRVYFTNGKVESWDRGY